MNNELPVSKHHIRESVMLVIIRIITAFFLLSFIYTVFLTLYLSFDFVQNQFFDLLILNGVFVVLMTILCIFILSIATSRLATDYYISEHALVIHKGLLKVEEEIYELKNIYTIKRYQSWWGRRFKYGDITVQIVAGSYQKQIRLHGIQKPKKYEKILEEYITKYPLEPIGTPGNKF